MPNFGTRLLIFVSSTIARLNLVSTGQCLIKIGCLTPSIPLSNWLDRCYKLILDTDVEPFQGSGYLRFGLRRSAVIFVEPFSGLIKVICKNKLHLVLAGGQGVE